ncbi:hypothetical protein CY34DRAFT_206825 [Suillus luteus UH-Slu-Lm8-n1]|uniref:Uncharacterized protein n=1 Tax=Suillus luteus UH-Slu-Lm8-n1 TaxID=930992 RepID=A0A0D0AHS1_9AGAM|nr:hypothetical protein CY34DRAFT_206825 [Suillus luteus UH-Slu-Lm8-n1]
MRRQIAVSIDIDPNAELIQYSIQTSAESPVPNAKATARGSHGEHQSLTSLTGSPAPSPSHSSSSSAQLAHNMNTFSRMSSYVQIQHCCCTSDQILDSEQRILVWNYCQ